VPPADTPQGNARRIPPSKTQPVPPNPHFLRKKFLKNKQLYFTQSVRSRLEKCSRRGSLPGVENSSASRPGEVVLLPFGLESSPAMASRCGARACNISAPALRLGLSFSTLPRRGLRATAPHSSINPPIHQSSPSLHASAPFGKPRNPKTPHFRLISPKIAPSLHPDTPSGKSEKPNRNAKIASSRPVSPEIRFPNTSNKQN
jgi:hypothetical protein